MAADGRAPAVERWSGPEEARSLPQVLPTHRKHDVRYTRIMDRRRLSCDNKTLKVAQFHTRTQIKLDQKFGTSVACGLLQMCQKLAWSQVMQGTAWTGVALVAFSGRLGR